ncbi:unnamed protein product [Protopolystoma xenopodis]|uniref:GCVT N-terminal domain-containing protein n=1 Tax=Protopolystoma xenopodis TaxID=117903 RepID=A0A448WNT0_9PLAT|nr:unnamed protein product [Protopolystoma xenopodis]
MAKYVLKSGLSKDNADRIDSTRFMQTLSVDSLFGLSTRENPGFRVTRCGYTGEDGFEISLPAPLASELAERILVAGDVRLIGLAARDTLRLEAGLCLYGKELDEQLTPVEAGLTWTIGKRRRSPNSTNKFPGFEKIISQINGSGLTRRRVGLIHSGGPSARCNPNIRNVDVKTGSGDLNQESFERYGENSPLVMSLEPWIFTGVSKPSYIALGFSNLADSIRTMNA